MITSLEDLQQLSRSQIEAASQSVAALSRGLQQIAREASDFAKTSVEEGSAALTKLIGVKSLEGAIQLQSELVRTACHNVVAGSARFGELVAALTKGGLHAVRSGFRTGPEPGPVIRMKLDRPERLVVHSEGPAEAGPSGLSGACDFVSSADRIGPGARHRALVAP